MRSTPFDTSRPNECRRPILVRISSKTKRNECELFAPNTIQEFTSDRAATTSDPRAPQHAGNRVALVTGATGFIGRAVASRLVSRGWRVRCAVRPESRRPTPEGVERVVNNIEVLPLSPNDDQIRMAVYRAVYGQASLNRYALNAVPPIHIIVKNGHVTLEGVVANEGDKNLANIAASGVPGVFGVTNNLRVENR